MKFTTIPFLPKNKIVPPDALYVDREGTLWIGSAEGLTSYQYKTGRFKAFTSADGLTRDRIRRIKEDMRGNLWISFWVGYVNRFSNGKFTLFNESHGLKGKRINAIVEDRNGNLLFATRENGVFKYKGGKFFKYPIHALGDKHIVNSMHEDRQGHLWIGTTNGLFRITSKGTERYTTREGLSNNNIADIWEDSDGNIWAGTEEGLNRINEVNNSEVGFDGLLKSLKVLCLFEDREKNLWVGTFDSGIKRLKDGKFESYAPLDAFPEETLFSLFQDRQGDTWIGTVSGKLFHCRDGKLLDTIRRPELSGTGIAAITEDAEGNFWLGTTGKGVFKKINGKFEDLTTNYGLSDNLVTSIFKDSRGDLWFSTFDGVSVRRHSNGAIESYSDGDGLPGKIVHNVYEDKGRNIWIAADKGITVLEEGKIAKQNKEYLQGIDVTCIYEDPSPPEGEDSVFWIATHGDGLKRLRLEDGMVTTYTIDQGIITNFLYRFFEDQWGNFWLMSNSGVLRVSKSELNRFAGGDRGTIHCTSFGVSDGMKSSQFNNEFSRHSALRTGNGELWFITRKGISIVNPEKIGINKTPPHVVIEAAFFNRHPIALHHRSDAEASIFKGKGDFSVRFTAPTFLSPEKVKFKYLLEGNDGDWIYLPPGKERVAHYHSLSPGTYTFKVTACNAEGIWNRTGTSITFTIEPFFYQTILFWIAVFFAAFIVAAFYFYRKRTSKEKVKEEVMETEEKEEEVKKEEFKKDEESKGLNLKSLYVEECIKNLRHLMDVEKVYRDETISLNSLAEKLSIPRHHLSWILNENLKRSCRDFINYYRIEEVKEKLKSPEKARKKITTLANEVGFNAMTAFYKAFKKFTGKTPTQYQKEVKKK
jgi:ligand-binding sensor domain-containing protein/AraC-like DNA-binding protein